MHVISFFRLWSLNYGKLCPKSQRVSRLLLTLTHTFCIHTFSLSFFFSSSPSTFSFLPFSPSYFFLFSPLRPPVAHAYITSSLTTDLCFLAHPGSIALAALRLAASQVLTHLQPIDTYLKTKLSEGEMQKLMVSHSLCYIFLFLSFSFSLSRRRS